MNVIYLKEKLLDKPLNDKQKQYEVLRALATEEKSIETIAIEFGYKVQSVRNIYSSFMADEISFFNVEKRGPKKTRLSAKVIKTIIEKRKQQYSIYDIKKHLTEGTGDSLSTVTISQILLNAGFPKLHRRTNKVLHLSKSNTLISERSHTLNFNDLKPFKVDCPAVGIFLFLPYILDLNLLDIVSRCNLPKSNDLSSLNAALSMLCLKLMGTERLSHIKSYDHEPGLGIFAGLNVLPKPSFIGSYSCRTRQKDIMRLQQDFVKATKKKYPSLYNSEYINLDFHSIPHFGEFSEMEKVWCGARGKTLKGANTLLAHDSENNVVTYTKADVLRKNEASEINKFVDYWEDINGHKINETLVFDCRLTSYSVLDDLNNRENQIKFITLRKRNKNLILDTEEISEKEWKKVRLPIPKRKFQKFLIYENTVRFKNCTSTFRQIIIKDHGRSKPTFVITNDLEQPVIKILEVYAQRWRIENKISELVSFFNLNALSSPLMVRIHFDLFWTLVADTLYRILAQDLLRFEKNTAGTLFKKFINFPGTVQYDGEKFSVKIRKRAHTPILLGIEKLTKPIKVPWLDNKLLTIEWVA